MNALVVVAREGRVEDVFLSSEEEVEPRFLSICAEVFSNFSDYTPDDIDAILDNGYEEGNDCAVCIHHLFEDADNKHLVISLSGNIVDDVDVFGTNKEARTAFVQSALSLAADIDSVVTKKDLRETEIFQKKEKTVQIFSVEE